MFLQTLIFQHTLTLQEVKYWLLIAVFITFDTDGNGPIVPADVVSSGTGGVEMGTQVCTENADGTC